MDTTLIKFIWLQLINNNYDFKFRFILSKPVLKKNTVFISEVRDFFDEQGRTRIYEEAY